MKNKFFGAVVGDIIGSAYEFNNVKTKDFELFCKNTSFTDDSVLTFANAKWLMEDKNHTHEKLVEIMQDFCHRYPHRGYGGRFAYWIDSENPKPYNSFGNGSAMRVSPVGLYAKSIEEAMKLAKISAEVTHNHIEGIKGAQSTAVAIFLAKTGSSNQEIKKYIEENFGYNLNHTLDEIRAYILFDETCQGTMPEAISAFLQGKDFMDVIKGAISLGGDSDTIAAIAGGISGAKDEIPSFIQEKCYNLLSQEFQKINDDFFKFID